MRCYKFHKYIDEYLEGIETEKYKSSREIKLMAKYVRYKLSQDYVKVDKEQIDDAVRVTEKYFNQVMFPWERFVFAMCHVYDVRDDTLLFDEFFIEMGRGNGKNGFISMLIWYFVTPNHGIEQYNIDIVANSEDQAITSFQDIYELIDEDKTGRLKKQFSKTKEIIINKKTKSYIKYNTSNAKTKDGKRTACIVFDEVHEYEDWKLINVFTSAFGKKPYSRIFYITTNGYVRGGVIDELLDIAMDVLEGRNSELSMLPLIYKLDSKEEVDDEKNWVKANPSLPYLPTLLKTMRREAVKMKRVQSLAIEFLTKRMNLPAQDTFSTVAKAEQVKATNRPIPYDKLKGQVCIGAIDYAAIWDFCSVGLLFKIDDEYVLIEHTFICHLALEKESRKLKFPVREMVDRGLITIIQEDTIKPSYIVNWFLEKAQDYVILDIKADDYRKAILEKPFQEAGLPLSIVRSGLVTHSKLAPLVDMIFSENLLVLGDNPTMRWYINNVMREMDAKGNTRYLKIEPELRKTDGFFMFLHALSGEEQLPSGLIDEGFYDMTPIF